MSDDREEDDFENEYLRIPQLIVELASHDDSVRKMAAFKLQSSIGDPSYADRFTAEGGLPKLQALTLKANGNTLAYSLASFSNLLGLDQGWECVTPELTERLTQLLVSHPLVNILRGAMAILVAIVSHPSDPKTDQFGFRALKSAIEKQPTFLEMLVSRLSSADHALCANALQLINALMRDSILNGYDSEWPKFIKRLQDLGVIRSVYVLMQGSGLQDLSHPLLEFQSLTKLLLRKWRDLEVDLNNPEHRRALKAIRAAGSSHDHSRDNENGERGRDPDKWRKLGFETESPARDFEESGFLGLMDFMDYVRKDEDNFQKLLLEQSTKPVERRSPVARTSLAVTSMLCAHFDIDDDEEDQQLHTALDRTQLDKFFKPLILQWSRLHTAGIRAFQRLWAETGAEVDDFNKVFDLTSTLLAQVISLAPRTKDVGVAESEIAAFELTTLRDLQMNLLEMTHEEKWGRHLRQVQDDLQQEALQFMREQRIRCLLQGAWFANLPEEQDGQLTKKSLEARTSWRFVRLSPNRKFVHYADFSVRHSKDAFPTIEELQNKIDLSQVSSVVSNVTSSESTATSPSSSTSTLRSPDRNVRPRSSFTKSAADHKITILGYANPEKKSKTHKHSRNPSSVSDTTTSTSADEEEITLLTLLPSSKSVAAEWLDGLLLLLNQTPITADTDKLIKFIADTGLKIRLLNVRFEEALGGFQGAEQPRRPEIPSRDGLDEDFYYDIGGA